MATTTIIPLHIGEGRSIAAALGRSTDYVKNLNKTDGGEWVTAYECDPLIADDEFLFSKRQYAAITGRNQGRHDVIGYHLRISFKPGEADAQTANRIGYDLALKLTKGKHAFVCCTHVDKAHTHSHIVINSTSLDCTRKFRNFFRSSFVIRRISDQLCLENGLSIIENPKPSKGKDYGDWLGESKPLTMRDKLEQIIDAALDACNDFDSFIDAMKTAGCEVKRNKNLAFKIPDGQKFIRCKSLGTDYTEDAIRERISGLRVMVADKSCHPAPRATLGAASRCPNLLIDIQAKLQQAKSPGFEHWARIYNLKESAKTLIFLQEHGLTEYEKLAEKTESASKGFHVKNERRKVIDNRLKEIAELQKYIGTYGKTREIYKQYISLPPKKREDFFEANRADITLHRAAKKHFDSVNLKKLPTIATLKQEYATLDVERRKHSQNYKAEREEMVSLLMAKQNVDRILGAASPSTKNFERDAR